MQSRPGLTTDSRTTNLSEWYLLSSTLLDIYVQMVKSCVNEKLNMDLSFIYTEGGFILATHKQAI